MQVVLDDVSWELRPGVSVGRFPAFVTLRTTWSRFRNRHGNKGLSAQPGQQQAETGGPEDRCPAQLRCTGTRAALHPVLEEDDRHLSGREILFTLEIMICS